MEGDQHYAIVKAGIGQVLFKGFTEQETFGYTEFQTDGDNCMNMKDVITF